MDKLEKLDLQSIYGGCSFSTNTMNDDGSWHLGGDSCQDNDQSGTISDGDVLTYNQMAISDFDTSVKMNP